MLQKRLFNVLSLGIILVMLLSACGTPAPVATATSEVMATDEPTMAPATETAVVPTETAAPVATAGPGEVPGRQPGKGGYLDEIDVSVVAGDSALSQIEAGAIDMFSYGLPPSQAKAVKDSGLGYTKSYSTYYSVMLNPAVFKDAAVLNPFSDRKIREAVNWIIDRDYINQEIYGGGALPRYFPLTTQLVDYTGVIETARALESKYAFNLEKGKQVIADEMKTLGATAGADGKWMYKGKPVTLTYVIRSDGDGTRKPQGDYVSTQFEAVGFTVDRQYKTSKEASPIWRGTDPVDGKWNMYTAGWGSPGLTRDEKGQFEQMYLPNSNQGEQVFIANKPDPAFQKLGDDLWQSNFTTVDQRRDLISKALTLALEDSIQVWVVDTQSFVPAKKNIAVTYDLASGFESASMATYNLRFTDKEGGALKIGTNDLFTDPWNPVAGSNWVWDGMVGAAMSSYGFMADPYTGLVWPQHAESAEVTAQTGLPISKSLDWLTLKTADTIKVPDDTWVDWDAKTQKWITAKEKFPDGTTAKVKSVVVYPKDLFTTVKWHDGSPLSVSDFLIPAIVFFDRGKKDSAIYDESAGLVLDAYLPSFKGWKITSTDPLTIESYSDAYQSDAELNVASYWPVATFGLSNRENSWHMLQIGNMAEAAKELAYSADKADANKVEYMSFVGGPSLEILAKELDKAIADKIIPYAPTMSEYLTADEATLRYNNYKAWYGVHKHFMIGTGPYYLDKAFLTEKNLVLKNNGYFTDPSDRWAKFSEPKLATATLDGPTTVKIGDTATFDVGVTFKDSPYPTADIKQVKYILYDATGAVLTIGEATAVSDGKYQVNLTAEDTAKLAAGSAKLEVAVVLIPAAIPAFTSIDFVVTK